MKTKKKQKRRCPGDKRGVRIVDAWGPWFRSFLAAPRDAQWSRDGNGSEVPCGEHGQIGVSRSALGEREGGGLQTEVDVGVRVDHDQIASSVTASLSPRRSTSATDAAVGLGRVERAFADLHQDMLHRAEWPDLASIRARCIAFLRRERERTTNGVPEGEHGVEPKADGWDSEKRR